MNKAGIIRNLGLKVLRGAKRATPTILTFCSAVGVVGVGVLSSMSTVKALRIIEERKANGDKSTPMEIAKAVTPAYILPTVVGAITVACMFKARQMDAHRLSALAALYASAPLKYAKKESDDTGKLLTAMDDNLLFYEEHYGEYFTRAMAQVIDAEYHMNRNFILRGYMSLNDFYTFLGLDHIAGGDNIGWSIEMGETTYGYSWIDFDHHLTKTDDGLECYVISMPFEPTADFLETPMKEYDVLDHMNNVFDQLKMLPARGDTLYWAN